MLRNSSSLAMRIAPGPAILFCTCLLFFQLSRANEFASSASGRYKYGSIYLELPATYTKEFNNAGWYNSIPNRQYSGTVLPRRSPVLPKERSDSDGERHKMPEPTAEVLTSTEPSPGDETPRPRPTPSGPGSTLFKDVYICRSSNAIWNVAVRNKMGELLLPAFATSEKKANDFAKCIREDLTDMAREEYLTFAMYNCVGTVRCSFSSATGTCKCNGKAPERCINIEYTRSLTGCRYST